MKPITLVLLLGMTLSFVSVQAQEFRFPSKVRIEGSKSYTYEALEAQEKRAENPRTVVDFTDEEYKERVLSLSGEIPTQFNALVKSHVKARVTRRRASTEKIVGRSMVYFPIFEEILRKHNMPTELKYLSVVESALNPNAVSPVGATGLWQFMAPTGKQYGLRISSAVDERHDPYAATDAAARYLADLYSRYGDWNLAIAAYNCGPGRVNSAVRDGGKSDYWAVAKFLPNETRNYVPAFIGAAYAMNFYHLHNIYPEHPEYELQVIDKTRVFDKISFQRISQITGLTIEAIKFMNPSFKYGYVPTNSKGYIVSLPLTVMAEFKAAVRNAPVIFGTPALLTYEEKQIAEGTNNNTGIANAVVITRRETVYRVVRGDNLAKIAKRYNCTVQELRDWNNIKGSLLQIGQQLHVMEEVRTQGVTNTTVKTPSTSQPQQPQPEPQRSSDIPRTQNATLHKVKRGESLWSIAQKNKIAVNDILKVNNMNANQKVQPGMQLVIPAR